jgi:hypothetical protein
VVFCVIKNSCVLHILLKPVIWPTHCMRRGPSWEAISCLGGLEIPFCHVTWRFVTLITRACYWFLPYGRWIQPNTQTIYFFRYILILFFHLCLGHPSRLKFRMNFWSHLCTYLPCACHRTWFDHSFNMRWRVQIWSSSLQFLLSSCHFVHLGSKYFPQDQPPLTSAFLGPKYFPEHHHPLTSSILGPNISLRTNLHSLPPSWVQMFPSGPTSTHSCLLGSKIFPWAPC